MYEDMSASRFAYGRFFAENERASACVHCGACQAKCPQGLEISKLLAAIHEKLK
jgi:predicted aldo/keto reductase-like oxidoreductase